MTEKIKCFGYVRVSTDEQASKGLSLADQCSNIKDYCTRKNLELVDTFVDPGISGSVPPDQRPEMKKLLDGLDNGVAIGMVACKLDRISRSLIDFMNIVELFNKKKYHLFLLNPDVDSNTSNGLFTLQLMASVAQLERNLTIERVKTTIAGKRSRNELIGSVPFGKRLKKDDQGKETKVLEDDPDEIKTIKIIMKERSTVVGNLKNKNKGKPKYKPYSQICDELIELKRKNKDGVVKWHPAQVKRIVDNELHKLKTEKTNVEVKK